MKKRNFNMILLTGILGILLMCLPAWGDSGRGYKGRGGKGGASYHGRNAGRGRQVYRHGNGYRYKRRHRGYSGMHGKHYRPPRYYRKHGKHYRAPRYYGKRRYCSRHHRYGCGSSCFTVGFGDPFWFFGFTVNGH